MKVYLDTSSLLKLYHQEAGYQELLEFVSTKVEQIYLSELAKIEFNSAIFRKVRTKEISAEKALQIVGFFENDYIRYKWITVKKATLNLA